MRYPASEKAEIIRLVAASHLLSEERSRAVPSGVTACRDSYLQNESYSPNCRECSRD